MTESHEGADRVDHGEASLGEAQAENAPDDPEMIRDEAEQAEDSADASSSRGPALSYRPGGWRTT